MRNLWVIGLAVAVVSAGCGELEPGDCEVDERYVSESYECGPDDAPIEVGPACLTSCDPSAPPNQCPEGTVCGAGNACIALCG